MTTPRFHSVINRSSTWILCSCLLGLALGCNSGDEWTAKRPKVYRASGTLKLDGQALEGATVIYHSQSYDVSAQGISDKNGKFQLTTYDQGDGAVAGGHKVVITKRIFEEKKTKYNTPEENSVALIPKDLLHKRYSSPDTTTVQVEIKSTGTNDSVIEIESK
ncbi:MAG: hypothetical protein ABL921_34270 [Pirellula sp.]